MKRGFILAFSLLISGALLFVGVLAQAQSPQVRQIILTKQQVGAVTSTCTPGTNASTFLARTSGLNATHTGAYCVLINWLDTKSLFTELDVVHVYGTQDTTTAILNLISTSFSAVLNGSPNFLADNGYLGVDSSSTVYIDTQFVPSTASGHYTADSAHISGWSFTNAVSSPTGGGIIGATLTSPVSVTELYPAFSDGNLYGTVNSLVDANSVANANSLGHLLINRSGANAQQTYKNAVNIGNFSDASSSLPNTSIVVLATRSIAIGNAVSSGGGYRIGAFTTGNQLSSAMVTDLCHGLNVFFTTVNGAASVC